jgi:glucokinase
VLLCGDIGGTKTKLGFFDRHTPLAPIRVETFKNAGVADFGAILSRFLGREPPALDAACFGIAGPVVGARVETTNLPWVIDAAALAQSLRTKVFLLNDLEALAYGVSVLGDEGTVVLNAGTAGAHGPRAIIAAGTGLGEAGLVWDERRWLAVASEGGHADFAPRNEREIALLRHLQGIHGHVSYERILSGPGLANVFEFLRDVEQLAVPPALAKAYAEGDPAAAIATAALADEAVIASAALEMFVAVYGAEAGNWALKLKATGGVWVGGGIAPKILPKLEDGTFLAAFLDKGRFADFLARVPVRVVVAKDTTLYGTACYAESRLD